MSDPAAETVTITMHGWAHGGQAVGRLPDGRACFVARALPGETVEVEVRKRYKRHATADLVRVVDASPHRVTPPCPFYGRCGGCQLQHVAPAHQLTLKRRVVVEQLERIAKVTDPPVGEVATPLGGWPSAYRGWARMAVASGGELGFRQARSHVVQPIPTCMLLNPATQALRTLAGDDWDGAVEVTLMADHDQALVEVTTSDPPGAVEGGALPSADHVGLVVDDRVQQGQRSITVRVHDVDLQTSAGAFFQAGPAGAQALVNTVLQMVDIEPDDVVADLYAGSGLLSVFLARTAGRVIAVEADPVAAADARANLADLDAEVVTSTVEAWLARHEPVDVVVLDPPRSGAKAEVTSAIAALGPRQIVYVACDPAALARDTATLIGLGYRLDGVQPLDLFGHTAHIEAVATFHRSP